jgi:REP element-mobilizing transposase RayT
MGRPSRIQFEGANYHIFSRGNRREPIFRDETDYQAFEDMMLEAVKRSGVLLYNWNQMPNHFHFNVETPDGNVAEFMQRLKTRFAKYFNAAHHLVGHVFQGRYGAVLCEKEAHFKEIARYVELNAYRLMGGRMLAPFGEWRWSSLHYLLMPEDRWPAECRTAFRQMLERFGEGINQGRSNFVEFLKDGLNSGTWGNFYRVKGKRFLGSEVFIERIKEQEEEPVRKTLGPLRRIASPDELRDLVVMRFGTTGQELASPGKGRRLSRLRQAMVYVGRHYLRMSVESLAACLGRQGNAVSMMLARTKDGIEKRPETIELLNILRTQPQRQRTHL